MATWVIVGGLVALALILTGTVLLILLFTRGETDDDVRLPRFKRFGGPGPDTAVPPDRD